jgi:hypothetical protein
MMGWWNDVGMSGVAYLGESGGLLVCVIPSGCESSELVEIERRVLGIHARHFGVGEIEGVRWVSEGAERVIWEGLLSQKEVEQAGIRRLTKSKMLLRVRGRLRGIVEFLLEQLPSCSSTVSEISAGLGMSAEDVVYLISKHMRSKATIKLFVVGDDGEYVGMRVIPDDLMDSSVPSVLEGAVEDAKLERERKRLLGLEKERKDLEEREKARRLVDERRKTIMDIRTVDRQIERVEREIEDIKGVSEQPKPRRHGGEYVYMRVIDDMRVRADMGLKKYGTYLQAHNGRDGLRDAYEEVLDLAVYLRQVIDERDERMKDAGELMKKFGV